MSLREVCNAEKRGSRSEEKYEGRATNERRRGGRTRGWKMEKRGRKRVEEGWKNPGWLVEGGERGIDVSVSAWWGGWAPINRRAAAPHLSTLSEINTATPDWYLKVPLYAIHVPRLITSQTIFSTEQTAAKVSRLANLSSGGLEGSGGILACSNVANLSRLMVVTGVDRRLDYFILSWIRLCLI